MKNIILGLMLLFSLSLFSQNTEPPLQDVKPTYKTWITGLNKPSYKGYLHNLTDSLIILKDPLNSNQFYEIDPIDVMGIAVRKKNKGWK